MDDLLREFLTETNESLDVVDVELVRFEQEPNNAKILGNIFRLVHTIKGTCGFLGLPRLEALAHAAETLMGKFRDGMPVTGDAVTLILVTIDRIKEILDELEREQREPEGADTDLIAELEQMARAVPSRRRAEPQQTVGTLVPQTLERPLRPGEVSLDELERAFRETPVPSRAAQAAPSRAARPADEAPDEDDDADIKVANQSIRVNVDTLEHLMTMVSELVLTRNQLLEIVRRHEDSEFKVPLQRLSNVTAELQEGVMKTRMQPIGNAWQKLPRIVRDLVGRARQGHRARDARRRDRARPPGARPDQGPAHPHGAQLRRSRPRDARPSAAPPASRRRARIRLSAYHEGGHIIIEIADDGRGLDTERIKAKALAQGLATEAEIEKMSEAQIHKFIFAPGFSTAAKVTSVSGRGVGMDVVRNNIDQIGGTIDVQVGARRGPELHHQDSADARDRLGADRRGRRRALRHPAACRWSSWCARSGKSEHRIERIKDAAGAAAAQQAAAAGPPEQPARSSTASDGDAGKRLHRRHAGRQPDLRHRGRRRVPHRGNRGQADVEQAAPHRACSPATPSSATAR